MEIIIQRADLRPFRILHDSVFLYHSALSVLLSFIVGLWFVDVVSATVLFRRVHGVTSPLNGTLEIMLQRR